MSLTEPEGLGCRLVYASSHTAATPVGEHRVGHIEGLQIGHLQMVLELNYPIELGVLCTSRNVIKTSIC
jgi:hypothetical protein